jgi:hypothetical protein
MSMATGPGTSERDIAKLAARLELLPDVGVSLDCLSEIAKSSHGAMADMRNRYPNSVAMVKYISNVMFWIIKLKPINPCALESISTGELHEVSNINEHIALLWGMHRIVEAVKKNKMPELIYGTPEYVANVEQAMRGYMARDIYFSSSTWQPVTGTNKYSETLYYLRFKKVTAVNIYETIVHLILGYKEGREASVADLMQNKGEDRGDAA